MAHIRCFDTYGTSNLSGSDYVNSKRRKNIFRSAQTLAIGNPSYQKNSPINNISPGYHKKKNGGYFTAPIYVNPLSKNQDVSGNNWCLIATGSYQTLNDVLRGKEITPTNEIAKNYIYALNGPAWLGNMMKIDFKSSGTPWCVSSNLPLNNPDASCNAMNYIPQQDLGPDPSGNNSNWPGLVVDPTYTVFYNNKDCINEQGNNYMQNVDYKFDSILINDNELFKLFSSLNGQGSDFMPYPLNFDTTKCKI